MNAFASNSDENRNEAFAEFTFFSAEIIFALITDSSFSASLKLFSAALNFPSVSGISLSSSVFLLIFLSSISSCSVRFSAFFSISAIAFFTFSSRDYTSEISIISPKNSFAELPIFSCNPFTTAAYSTDFLLSCETSEFFSSNCSFANFNSCSEGGFSSKTAGFGCSVEPHTGQGFPAVRVRAIMPA